MTDSLTAKALSSRGQRGRFLLSLEAPLVLKNSGTEKIDSCYYSAHTMKKRVGSMSALGLNMHFIQGQKRGRLHLRIKYTGYVCLGKVREDKMQKEQS